MAFATGRAAINHQTVLTDAHFKTERPGVDGGKSICRFAGVGDDHRFSGGEPLKTTVRGAGQGLAAHAGIAEHSIDECPVFLEAAIEQDQPAIAVAQGP